MNPKTPRYAFRTTAAPLASKEKPLYLLSATLQGRRFEFVADVEHARWFTRTQRGTFDRRYPFLRGRWARVPKSAIAMVTQ